MNSVNNLTLDLTYNDIHYNSNEYGWIYNDNQCTTYAYDSALYLLDSKRIALFNRSGYGNACNWYDQYLYDKGQDARIGAIACWRVSDGGSQYGHVAIVTCVNPDGTIDLVEGGGGCRWTRHINYNYHRSNFIGFLYLPNYVPPTPSGDLNIGDNVIISGSLYPNANADYPSGTCNYRKGVITRKVNGKHPYNTTGDLGWCDASSLKKI